MTTVTEAQVLESLAQIKAPGGGDIVSQKMVSGVFVNGGKVMFSLNVPADQAQTLEPLRLAAQRAIEALAGVEKATAVMTAEKKGAAPAQAGHQAGHPSRATGAAAGGAPGAAPSAARPKMGLPGVKSIVAVASGKGGVGKSTTAVNLALALQREGKKVGILDADIYGPSLPRMVGVNRKPTADGRVMQPIEAYGLKVMSIGFLVEEDTAMIWRGPMVMSALTQMLREVAWGELDVMVVDMPPGTGDAQLTMAQQVPLAGAVIVSTPQDIALIDARKGINMFRKTDVPLLGVVENMSFFICPSCGDRADIFGHGGAREEAAKMGVPLLGEVPLHMDIRRTSDGGHPIVVAQPNGPHAQVYGEIARGVIAQLEARAERKGPAIVFE